MERPRIPAALRRRATLIGLGLVPLLAHRLAAQPPPAPIRADQPWARATAPSQSVGGGYVTLTSPANDRLVSATSPAAARVELHEMRMDGPVMRMRELPTGIALPAGQSIALAPGGLHIMLMDLKAPLVAGQTVPLTLRFERAPPLELMVQIAPVGAQRAPAGQAH